MGCHLMMVRCAPPAIPRLKDRLVLPNNSARSGIPCAGPGAANSLLTDARLAAVLNWIVTEYAGASQPANWTPYEVAEVAKYRKNRPADVDVLRHTLTDTIASSYPDARNW